MTKLLLNIAGTILRPEKMDACLKGEVIEMTRWFSCSDGNVSFVKSVIVFKLRAGCWRNPGISMQIVGDPYVIYVFVSFSRGCIHHSKNSSGACDKLHRGCVSISLSRVLRERKLTINLRHILYI